MREELKKDTKRNNNNNNNLNNNNDDDDADDDGDNDDNDDDKLCYSDRLTGENSAQHHKFTTIGSPTANNWPIPLH